MLWVQTIFFLVSVLVIITNLQQVVEYNKSKKIAAAKKFPLKKWNLLFTTLLATGAIISILQEWISIN